MSAVYFIAADENVSFIEKLDTLLERAVIGNLDGIVALKTHMGERRNKTFIKPRYVRKLVEVVKQHGGDPFVTDTMTIYKEGRCIVLD